MPALKVFLSWSGDRSRKVAEALREWLPNVLQAAVPWMSAEDIEKGSQWNAAVSGELSTTRVGIICVTPENLDAPWLNFEAGALSRTLDRTFVTPYLTGLRPTDLRGPLVQFQAAMSDESDTRKLIATLNRALGESALSEKKLDKAFGLLWPELHETLSEIKFKATPARPKREDRDLLEELLELVRSQTKQTPITMPLLRFPLGTEQVNQVGLPDANTIELYKAPPASRYILIDPIARSGVMGTAAETPSPFGTMTSPGIMGISSEPLPQPGAVGQSGGVGMPLEPPPHPGATKKPVTKGTK